MIELLVDFIFIFFVTWWISIFLVLPFFSNRDDAPEIGNDTGAPKNLNIKKVFYITTILAFLLSAGYLSAVRSGLIDLQKFDESSSEN